MNPIARLLAAACAGALQISAMGCVALEKYSEVTSKVVPHETVGNVIVMFNPSVSTADDTVTPGGEFAGLIGQVWLTSQDGKRNIPARGAMIAELFDLTNHVPGQPAPRLADWIIANKDLKRMEREDKFGLGYTLFLPWDKYNPGIKKVQMRVTYVDERGTTHQAVPATMNLRGLREAIPVSFQQKTIPAIDLPAPPRPIGR